MSDLLQDLGASVSALGGNWTKYSVVGSFVLYLFGYLAVRFHLTAIGIGTDLAVLDERYLFAGARFFVYLVSSVPSILLILLPIFGRALGAREAQSSGCSRSAHPARPPAGRSRVVRCGGGGHHDSVRDAAVLSPQQPSAGARPFHPTRRGWSACCSAINGRPSSLRG